MRCLELLYSKLYQKPLYTLFYNTKGNQFCCKGNLLNSKILLIGGGNKLLINSDVELNNVRIEVTGNNNTLILNKGVRFSEGGRIRLQDNNNTLEIGENSRMINVMFTLGDNGHKIIIGKDCLFSANVILRTNDGHSILNKDKERINHPKSTIIGDRVWIGYGANVLKGTEIGNDCIVGTQSLVTGGSFPSNCIIAGSPAKVVKKDVTWDVRRL